MKYSESNQPLVCMMTQSTCYKGTVTMEPKGVLWHSTGANNPELRRYVQPDDNAPNRDELLASIGKNDYGNDWNHISRQAGLNAWIGKLADGSVASVQTMPWSYKPWGCGKGSKGSCNNGWIQFEICEDGLLDKDYFEAVYREACELTAYCCKMFNLNPKGTVKYQGIEVPVILDHRTSYKLQVGGNHWDVYHWFAKYGKTMDDVRNDVAKLMNETQSTAKIEENDGEYTKGKPIQLSTNFKSTEFDCHGNACCSLTYVDQKLVEYLQNIREHFDKPVNVSSGYRCPIHNKNVGGATASRHARGQAADIYINGVDPIEIARYAEEIGILGIGLYETDEDGHFVHVDTRTTKAFWYGQSQIPRDTFKADVIKVPVAPQLPGGEAPNREESRKMLKAGDLVTITKEAAYYTGKLVPGWVKERAWYVEEDQVGNRVIINKSEDGSYSINSPINRKYLILKAEAGAEAEEEKEFKSYLVKITASRLNYRQGPSTNYEVVGYVEKDGVFTIVAEQNGWGKLKSGAGWIHLGYTEKL